MKKVADVIGRKSEMGEAIRVFLRRIQFSNSSRTRRTLVSVREEIAWAFECQSQVRGVSVAQKVGGPEVYGNYYGVIFEGRKNVEESKPDNGVGCGGSLRNYFDVGCVPEGR
jgi:hypothetical protein